MTHKDRPVWMDSAACADLSSDLFYPGQVDFETFDAAVKVCRGCPVRFEFLEYALNEPELYGVWGGLGARERSRIRRQRRRSRAVAA